MKKLTSSLLTLCLCAASLVACGQKQSREPTPEKWPEAVQIRLADEGITVDGETVSTEETASVYTASDIVYYESGKDFTYGEGTEADAHSPEEAAAHTVVHITQPGSYILSGSLSAGQIAVDLGEDAEDDPNAVVTLILDGMDITCTVAPAVIFYNVYECGSADEATATKDVDTSAAGANVIIADGSYNTVNGSYVARIYKPESVVLSEDGTEVEDAKKLHKYDAAFYSRMSMNMDGETTGASNMNAGSLSIHAENEGLDSELHLTINGGLINIISGNDGINTNEDNVSVTTINGGSLGITVTGETGEGDGIDSNGWLIINGGTVVAAACGHSMDSGIDADRSIHINGGTVIASGHMLDRIEDGGQNYMVFSFAGRQSGGTDYTLKPEDGHFLATYSPVNDYSILLVSDASLTAGDYTLWQGGSAVDGVQIAHGGTGGFGPGMGGFRPGGFGSQPPEGFEPPEGFDPGRVPEGFEPPEGFDPSQMPEGMEQPDRGGFDAPEPNEDGTIPLPGGAVLNPETEMVTLPDGSEIPYGSMSYLAEEGNSPRGLGSGQENDEGSVVFALADGGSLFSSVKPAAEA